METAAPSAPAPTPTTSAAPAPAPAPSTEAPKADATSSTPVSPTTETAAEKKARLLKLKIDGGEEEVDVNSLADDELAKELQMARAARKRMNEAAEERKKVAEERARIEEALKYIKDNPSAAFKELGHDFDEIAEQYFAARIQEQQKLAGLTEDQKEVMRLKQQLADRENAEKTAAEKKQQEAQLAEQQRIDNEIAERITKDFDEAAKLLDLGEGRDPFVYGIMAEVANVPGIELTPQQIVAETRERMNFIHRTFTSKLDGAALLNHLGPDTVRKVLRSSAAKLKAAKATPTPAPVVNNVKQEQKAEEFMSLAEFRRSLK